MFRKLTGMASLEFKSQRSFGNFDIAHPPKYRTNPIQEHLSIFF